MNQNILTGCDVMCNVNDTIKIPFEYTSPSKYHAGIFSQFVEHLLRLWEVHVLRNK